MGAKITVDCASLMNKGLELIEAMRLFDMPPERVDVVIHRQSIIHSLVEFRDGAVLAQLGTPDMRLPIRYALTYPHRAASPAEPLDLLACPPLTFAPPDTEAFPCLRLAMDCAKTGGTVCAVSTAPTRPPWDCSWRNGSPLAVSRSWWRRLSIKSPCN